MNTLIFLAFASLSIAPADIPFNSVVTAAEVYPMGSEADPRPTLYLYAPGVECAQRDGHPAATAVAYINNVPIEVEWFDYFSRGHIWIIRGNVKCWATPN